MILDINQDPIRDCVGVHRDLSSVLRELERVLQQISDGRKKHVAVDIDRKTLVDDGYCQFTFTGTRLEQCGDPDLIHEIGKGDEKPCCISSRPCNAAAALISDPRPQCRAL